MPAFLILMIVTAVLIFTKIYWAKISYEWLERTSFLLAISFPFERIPSLETAVGPIRLAMVLVGVSLYLILMLLFKKDPRLLSTRITNEVILVLLFFVAGSLSFWGVTNFTRFIVSYLGILISFSTALIIGLFLGNRWWKALKTILFLFVILIVFSTYQFLGDLAGLPGNFTGMKDLFMSHVFGLPRIHATFNEPAYFANALFLGLFGFLFLSVSDLNLIPVQKGRNLVFSIINHLHKNFRTTYFVIFLVLLILFLATLAKSAWLILPITLLPALIIVFRSKNFHLLVFPISLVALVTLFAGFWFNYNNPQFIYSVSNNIVETISGNSATAVERSSFLDASLEVLPAHIISGIGSGQFGTYAKDVILYNITGTNASQLEETEKLIVFNVYAEVWLEQGLIPFLLFLALFIMSVCRGIKSLFRSNDLFSAYNFGVMVLVFYLISSMLQWNFISPLYINPIFVALGLLIYANNHKNEILKLLKEND